MTQITVNENLLDGRPLATEFFSAITRHDYAERVGDDGLMDITHDRIREIEDAAVTVAPVAASLPDTFYRLCVARGRLNDIHNAHHCGQDIEPHIVGLEALLDHAMDGLLRMTHFDAVSWRFDYYAPVQVYDYPHQ